jgi:hypothetical protein
MTASVIQTVGNTTNNASVSSVTLTVTNTVAGNTLAVFFIGNSGGTYTTSDNVNAGNYTKPDNLSAAGFLFDSFYKANIAGGTVVITTTFGGTTTQYAIIACEIGGVTSSSFDGHIAAAQGAPGTGTDAITTGSGASSTNANFPALVVAAAYIQSANLTIGTGLFSTSASVGGLLRVENKRVISSAAQAATFTTSASATCGSLLMIFDESATAPVIAWIT